MTPPQDTEADRDMDEVAARYREASGRPEPPAALDRRILAEARRRPAPRRIFSPFPHNWMVPASVAALLVMTISIVHWIPDSPLPPTPDAPVFREEEQWRGPEQQRAPERAMAKRERAQDDDLRRYPANEPALDALESPAPPVAPASAGVEAHAPAERRADAGAPELLGELGARSRAADSQPELSTYSDRSIATPPLSDEVEAMLRAIGELIAEGRLEEARRRLAELERRHPELLETARLRELERALKAAGGPP